MARASEARAPGKVILLGEHAVVYGQPALALPLDRGVTVRCAPAERLQLVERPSVGAAQLEEALSALARELGDVCVGVSIHSELPLSTGLGSSAAVAVASARALSLAAGRSLDDAQLLALAAGMERTFHGKPSGIDHTTSLRAVPLLFRRGEPDRVERLRVPNLALVVASAGPRDAGTRAHVMGLRAEYERDPSRLQPLFSDIGALAQAGAAALAKSDLRELGRLMNANQELLHAMGVSTPAIDALVSELRNRGAYGAKLTGAGGGGAVIAVHDDPDALARALPGAFATRWSDA